MRPLLLLISLLASIIAGCTGAPPAAVERPLTLVAIGASDAVGVGASDPLKTGWVPQLHQKLPAGTRLVNLGISGAKVADAIDQELPVAVDVDPDLVVVWIAVNDLIGGTPLPEYERGLDLLLGDLAGRTRARVFVANVPNLSALPGAAGLDRAAVAALIGDWNAAIERAVTRNNATLVDLASSWQELVENPQYVSADGFHPSDDGYRRLAELFWDALDGAGVPRRA
jgi:lysophospholipase L1-like esterase